MNSVYIFINYFSKKKLEKTYLSIFSFFLNFWFAAFNAWTEWNENLTNRLQRSKDKYKSNRYSEKKISERKKTPSPGNADVNALNAHFSSSMATSRLDIFLFSKPFDVCGSSGASARDSWPCYQINRLVNHSSPPPNFVIISFNVTTLFHCFIYAGLNLAPRWSVDHVHRSTLKIYPEIKLGNIILNSSLIMNLARHVCENKRKINLKFLIKINVFNCFRLNIFIRMI